MGKRTIQFSLSEKDIERATRDLNKYKQDIIRKTKLLREKVAQRIETLVQSGFTGAIVDDVIKGESRQANVQVSLDERDNVSIVIAKGEDAIWIEFGAGVYHNGSAGTSPHPKGSELGFTIGGYGKGMGKRKVWGFYKNGSLTLTHGTPATMPMYNAMKTACNEISEIAKEVFK